MEKVTRETVTTETNAPSVRSIKDTDSRLTAANLVYYVFGVLEFLLIIRLLFKFLGANPGSYFISVVYEITRFFIMPFQGIFQQAYNPGIETTSIFEPATFVAIIVYMFVALGIVKLITMNSPQPE